MRLAVNYCTTLAKLVLPLLLLMGYISKIYFVGLEVRSEASFATGTLYQVRQHHRYSTGAHVRAESKRLNHASLEALRSGTLGRRFGQPT